MPKGIRDKAVCRVSYSSSVDTNYIGKVAYWLLEPIPEVNIDLRHGTSKGEEESDIHKDEMETWLFLCPLI